MDRRSLLKTLTVSTAGYALATPTILQLLTSCSSEKQNNWKPLFLDEKQAFMVTQLADVILPSSQTPGALEIDTPRFLDLILKEVVTKEDQKVFRKGAVAFQNKFAEMFKKDILKGTKEDFDSLLALYFKISSEKQNEIFGYIRREDSKKGEKETLYYIYKFLIFVRKYTLFAFYTSEKIGTEVLTYEPVPGKFEACISTEEAGNVSSL